MPALDGIHVANGTSEPSSSAIGSVNGDSIYHEQNLLDIVSSPEWRTQYISPIQAWIIAHPKLATFISLNFVLTGIPVILFIVFVLSTGFFSLVVGLLLTAAGCVIFTLSCAGFALTVLIPTVFLTTTAACTVFFWALVGYYVLGLIGSGGNSYTQQNRPDSQDQLSSKMQTPSKDPILGRDQMLTVKKLPDNFSEIWTKSVAT